MTRQLGIFNECRLIDALHYSDSRGSFLKSLYSPFLDGISIHEQYITTSCPDVVRGMHFQVPPFEHHKIVTCITGSALDVVLDLRSRSSTFLKYESVKLLPCGPSIIIPPGFAHGFLALEADTRLLYNVSSPYSPIHDKGVHFASFGFTWPVQSPIISDRDRALPPVDTFQSPF